MELEEGRLQGLVKQRSATTSITAGMFIQCMPICELYVHMWDLDTGLLDAPPNLAECLAVYCLDP